MPDDLIVPASHVWIAPGAGQQQGTILLGLTLAESWEDGSGMEVKQVAIGMSIEKAKEVIRTLQAEIDSLQPSGIYPVIPLYPQRR